eukprot:13187846-Heterocapsa_arctica.AAC.1
MRSTYFGNSALPLLSIGGNAVSEGGCLCQRHFYFVFAREHPLYSALTSNPRLCPRIARRRIAGAAPVLARQDTL